VREVCREFSKESIKSQIESYVRWGVMHDYRYSYMSINSGYEANVVETFAQFLGKDMVYRGDRPVFWSTKDKRILAEEELEDMTKLGQAHLVEFEVKSFGESSEDLAKYGTIKLVAFVKEPWRMVGTHALAINPNQKYGLIKKSNREYLIVAVDRVSEISTRLKNHNMKTNLYAPGKALFDMVVEHPFFPNRDLSVIPDDTIKTSFGTGVNIVNPLSNVHDLSLAEQYNINTESFLTKDGKFTKDLNEDFEGLDPFKKGNQL